MYTQNGNPSAMPVRARTRTGRETSGKENDVYGRTETSAGKRFFSGVLVLTLSNLLVKAAGLLFKIPMNYIVGDTGMGYYNAAYTLYAFFYILSTAGLPIAVSILISEAAAQQRTDAILCIRRCALWLFTVVGGMGTALLWLGAERFAQCIGAPPAAASIRAVAPTLLFVCIASAMRGYFQGFQNMTPTAISQLMEALGKLVFGIVGALYGIRTGASAAVTAAYAVLGLTVGTAAGMLYLLATDVRFSLALCKNRKKSTAERGAYRLLLRRFAGIALPVTLSSSVMSLTNLIDVWLIQKLLQESGMTQEMATTLYGNYTSLAVPMFNLPPVFVYPIACSLVPLVARLQSGGENEKAKHAVQTALRLSACIGAPCALGMTALAKPILALFYRAESVEIAAPLLTLLAPSSFFLCVLAVTNSVLQGIGKAHLPVLSMLAGAALKTGVTYILVGRWGMIGTPVGTFVCYMTVTGINLLFVYRYTHFSPVRTFGLPVLAGGICAATAALCEKMIAGRIASRAAVLLSIAVAAAVYIPLLFCMRMVGKEELALLPGNGMLRRVKKRGSVPQGKEIQHERKRKASCGSTARSVIASSTGGSTARAGRLPVGSGADAYQHSQRHDRRVL